MKAIIDGKLYDTEKASVIAVDGQETFYKTNNGSYFQVGEYGIIPSDIPTIKKVLGEHDIEAYIKEFGDVEEA